MNESEDRLLLTVLRGAPTPEQLAALIAVVSTTAAGDDELDVAPAPSLWSRPGLRASLQAGPGAWRASGLPGGR